MFSRPPTLFSVAVILVACAVISGFLGWLATVDVRLMVLVAAGWLAIAALVALAVREG